MHASPLLSVASYARSISSCNRVRLFRSKPLSSGSSVGFSGVRSPSLKRHSNAGRSRASVAAVHASAGLAIASAASADGHGRDEIHFFAYGALMWNNLQPDGFEIRQRVPASLQGYRRELCLYSWRYRGTEDKPGLVLGLEPGGTCDGVLLSVATEESAAALRYFDEQELISNIYQRKFLPAAVGDERKVVGCHVYVTNPESPQYCPGLSLEQRAQLVLQGIGSRGTSLEYLEETLACMESLGIRDEHLAAILRLCRERE